MSIPPPRMAFWFVAHYPWDFSLASYFLFKHLAIEIPHHLEISNGHPVGMDIFWTCTNSVCSTVEPQFNEPLHVYNKVLGVTNNILQPDQVKPSSQGWLIAAGAYPGFCSMKRLEVFLLPLDGMLVHRRSLPCNFVRFPQQIAGTHLYTWVEGGTVRVKYLAQQHNTLSRPGLEPGPLAPDITNFDIMKSSL